MFENAQNQLTLAAQASQNAAVIAAAEAAKARIQAQFIMAIQRPRDMDLARQRLLKDCQRPGFAEIAEYAKPVGGGRVRGPSIRFAEVALRHWGNVDIDTTLIYEDEIFRKIKVTCTDLETNSSFSKTITINKTVERKNRNGREVLGERTNTNGEVVWIVKATEDELGNKEAALISKAIRNEGLRLLPTDIKDEAMAMCRDTLRKKDAQDPDAARKKICDAFMAIGIKPHDLRSYLKHDIDVISPAEIDDLRTIYQTLKDGEAKWSDYVEEEVQEKIDEINEKYSDKAAEKPSPKKPPAKQSKKESKEPAAKADSVPPPPYDEAGEDEPPVPEQEPPLPASDINPEQLSKVELEQAFYDLIGERYQIFNDEFRKNGLELESLEDLSDVINEFLKASGGVDVRAFRMVESQPAIFAKRVATYKVKR